VFRGTLLHVIAHHDSGEEHCYFMNTAHGRQTVDRIRRGELRLPEGGSQVRLEARRPNICSRSWPTSFETPSGPTRPIGSRRLFA